MKYYLSLKNKTLTHPTTRMNLKNIVLGEISQTKKDKSHIISLICSISNIELKAEGWIVISGG